VCDSPDQAAHYHTLGPKLSASSVTRHLAGVEVKAVFLSTPLLLKPAMLGLSYMILSQLNPFLILTTKFHFNIIPELPSSVLCGLARGFTTKIVYAFLVSFI
jgi:hypothetical protein